MTKQLKEAIKQLPYYTAIVGKGRYSGIKAKAWAILSDYVRMRDFYLFGYCVSCKKKIIDWRYADAGHFISMGGHGASIGFSASNIHMQCKHCNQQSSFHLGESFGVELRHRGIDTNDLLRLAQQSIKADDWFFLEIIKDIYIEFKRLKSLAPHLDYPDYLNK